MPLRPPTFAEREGAKPLPTQLQLKNISAEVRARIWNVLYESLTDSRRSNPRGVAYLSGWGSILRDSWVKIDHRFSDQFPSNTLKQIEYAKEKMTLEYSTFLEFIEFVVTHQYVSPKIPDLINAEFEQTGCAYRIQNSVIVPISNEQMATTFSNAMESLEGEFAGAQTHLATAARALSARDYAGSIRESIHAVESVARKMSGAKTLGPALDKISAAGLHPALKKGFSSLYGFTSDEHGIRHALLEGDMANIGEQEALYMLGSCAAFSSYLKNRFIDIGLAITE